MSVATGVSLSGPAAGSISAASTPFTIALTPAGGTNVGDAVTATLTGVAGTTTPSMPITLSTATPSATFTLTPTAEGTMTITITDAGGLTMGAPVIYKVFGAAPAMQQLMGDAVAPNQSARLTVVPGAYEPVEVTITSLPGPLGAASLAVGITQVAETLLTKAGLIVDPGTAQANGTYTAKVIFECLEADTTLLPASSLPYVGKVTATASVAGGSHLVPAIDNLAWQSVAG